MSLWPVHPHPLPDELLSSWMIRLARSNGFKVHSFYSQFFGRERQIWNRDIDHYAPPWLIDGLAKRTGTSRESIVRTTLRAFESFAFERFIETGVARWTLPLGIFHRTRRAYGQQFCPSCLIEDAEPYLRRTWRLALVVVCTRHGILLQDRCASCGRPLAPHRSDMAVRSGFPERTTMLRCAGCGSCIAGPKLNVSKSDICMQQRIDATLINGFFMLEPGRAIYSHLYFDGLRMVMRVALRPQEPRSRGSFEFASIRERLELLRNATQLVEEWPTRLIRHCVPMPHAYTTISGTEERVPYWLDSVLRKELFRGRALLSKAEAEAIVQTTSHMIGGAASGRSTRLLSGRDVMHLLPVRPEVDDNIAAIFIASLDREIINANASRRSVLMRDRSMFVVARYLRLSAKALLELKVKDIARTDAVAPFLQHHPENAEMALAVLRWYLKNVRTHFPTSETAALFTTFNGNALAPTALGMRFQRAVRAAQMKCEIHDWTRWVRIQQRV